MSTHEGALSLPFIANLIGSRVVERAAEHGRQGSVLMKEKAICLDDDPLSLRLVEHLLKRRYEVVSCANLAAAVRAVREHRADLFLCDYHLGDRITGAQAYQILRDEHGFNPAHKVLITSYPSPEIAAEIRAMGFDCMFAKPLRREFQEYCLNLRSRLGALAPSVLGC